MAKKKPIKPTKPAIIKPVKVKDPKKVAAGKARAATAIKNEKGQYVSKIFTNEIKKTLLASKKIDVSKIAPDQTSKIDDLLKEAKLTQKEVKKFYDKNKPIFDDLLTFGKLKGTSKNSNQIGKVIDQYKGKFFLDRGNGKIKEVSAAQMKYELTRFKNALSSNLNLVDFSLNPTFSIDGNITLKIPNTKKFFNDLKTYFGVKTIEELEDFDGAEIMEAAENILKGYYNNEPDLTLYIS